MATSRSYWLMKSEPGAYSIQDLEQDRTTSWDGIRNYQARNYMRDKMNIGDRILFYHSNAKPPGIVGLAEVCAAPYPDHTAWDASSPYFDPRSTQEKPVWIMVDVRHLETFRRLIPLDQLRAEGALDGMLVTRKGQRLSIQPVRAEHFQHVMELAGKDSGLGG